MWKKGQLIEDREADKNLDRDTCPICLGEVWLIRSSMPDGLPGSSAYEQKTVECNCGPNGHRFHYNDCIGWFYHGPAESDAHVMDYKRDLEAQDYFDSNAFWF